MKQRLDIFLVENSYVKSRNLAQELIKNSKVLVNGIAIIKVAYLVSNQDKIELIKDQIGKYVSRGGLKLEHALNSFKFSPKGLVALDIGASTGGFSDCLLQFGAKKVIALDVGINQLDPSLRGNKKITVLEKTNFRSFDFINLDTKVDLVVIDVSFISLTLILDNLVKNSKKYDYENISIIALIKPEFELSKKELNKAGVVRSRNLEKAAIVKVLEFSEKIGIKLLNIINSPLVGAKGGNREYLGLFQYNSALKNGKITTEVDFNKLGLGDRDDTTNNN